MCHPHGAYDKSKSMSWESSIMWILCICVLLFIWHDFNLLQMVIHLSTFRLLYLQLESLGLSSHMFSALAPHSAVTSDLWGRSQVRFARGLQLGSFGLSQTKARQQRIYCFISAVMCSRIMWRAPVIMATLETISTIMSSPATLSHEPWVL